MHRYFKAALPLSAAALISPALCVRVLALGDTSTSAGPCSVAAGREASNNTLTCNFGLNSPEQLREVTRAAVEGATASYAKQVEEISKRLGVTEEAAKTLLRIAGEQDVPDERLAETLTKIANDYKRLQEQVAALSPENPVAKKLVEQAKPEIDAGHFERADDLLREAEQAELAAADQAEKLANQAIAARDARKLGAASVKAARADVALTQRHYKEAAELFGQAAARWSGQSSSIVAFCQRHPGSSRRSTGPRCRTISAMRSEYLAGGRAARRG
jgi:hypothetical protein